MEFRAAMLNHYHSFLWCKIGLTKEYGLTEIVVISWESFGTISLNDNQLEDPVQMVKTI